MTTIPLIFAAGHMFADLPEGRWLVDTGLPITFGRGGTITWDGRRRQIPSQFGPFRMEQIQPHVNMPIVGMVGVDLLNAQDLCWDGPAGECRVGEEPNSAVAASLRFTSVMGVPVMDALLGGQVAKCILDTGAQFGYLLDRGYTRGAEEDEVIHDFNPILGDIVSPSWKVEVKLDSVGFVERFGLLEGRGGAALGLMGVDGVIGCSWMAQRKIWYRPGELTLSVA